MAKLDDSKKSRAAIFVQKLYAVYVARHFTYLEINPLVITDEKIYILDLAAKLDSAADYLFANCPVRSVKPNYFLANFSNGTAQANKMQNRIHQKTPISCLVFHALTNDGVSFALSQVLSR